MKRADLCAMPIFDPATAAALRGAATDADQVLDLRGLPRDRAEMLLRETLAASRQQPATLMVRLDPATPISGETLFLPIGRQLLQARRDGLVLNFAPLPEAAGAGFHAVLAARRSLAA